MTTTETAYQSIWDILDAYQMTYAEAIGVLEMIKSELLEEAKNLGNEDAD